MLEIILVRHGETDSNIRGTYCGWTDAKLNEKGLQQAYGAAEKLRDIRPDIVYSSPLKRAFETAEIICKESCIHIVPEKSLMEQSFGKWEDLTYTEIHEKYPEDCMEWQNDWMNYCIKDGESSYQMYRRVSWFIDRLVALNNSGVILLVTHLGCIRFILSHLLGMSNEGFWRFRVDNGGICKVVVTNDKYAYIHGLNN